jgi:hypothetical protein
MTAANQQIITAFEELDMTPEEIAAEQDLELTSVKAILMQFSGLYREQCKVKDDLNFTDEEEVAARQVITNIARYSEDERLRLRAAIYIRDDKKGRLDVVKQMNGLNINVIHFNDQMKRAIAAKERAKQIINISPEQKQLVDSE